nr:ABC transporter substrate-binding protein [Kofleriaceae bacterium]
MTRAWLAVAVAGACTACSADHGPRFHAAGSRTPRAGGVLHVATEQHVSTLDPALAADEVSLYAIHAMFDTLVDYAPGSTALVPRLAARWDMSADARRFTFTLRDGVTYADGAPVVAADVAASLDRARTLPDSPYGSYLADVSSIAAPDARTLAIELAHPDAAFIYTLTMSFTAPAHRAGDGALAGAGPFTLAAWEPGVRVVLARNPRYYDAARVHVAGVELRENVPADVQFLAFERGELDAVDHLAAPDYQWLAGEPAWQPYLRGASTLSAFGWRMNVRVPPFDDVRVRRALNYADDKAHALRILGGTAEIAHGLLPPGVPGRDDALAPYPHDAAAARRLLAEAGHADGLDVELVTYAGDEPERLAQSLQADLAEVGVRARIVTMSFAAYQTAIGKPDGPPLSLAAWGGDSPDPTSFLDAKLATSAIGSDASANDSFYSNPALDDLLDRARAERDPARRAELYRRAERIVFDDAPWIFEYHRRAIEVVQPYLMGYDPHPVGIHDYASAWLDREAGE